MSQPSTSPKESNSDHVLLRLMSKGKYEAVLEALHHREKAISVAALGSKSTPGLIEKWRGLFDELHAVDQKMPQKNLDVFRALVYLGLKMDGKSIMAFEPVEAIDQTKISKYGRQRLELRLGLADHPFVISLRKSVNELSRQAAVEVLRGAWTSGDKPGFLYLFSVHSVSQRRQYQYDKSLPEQSLAEDVATAEGLELVVISAPRGSNPGYLSTHAELPQLRVIISNTPVPVDYVDQRAETPVSEWAEEETGFWLLSAKGTYMSLRGFMSDALKERKESIGHGPYNFVSEDDRSYGTAANVMAAVHDFLAVPSNFASSAQARAKEQVAAIHTAALGPIYAYRYLREGSGGDWSLALNVANFTNRRALEKISSFEASKTLVEYGLVSAMDDMLMVRLGEQDDREAAEQGYVAGLEALKSDMEEILDAEGEVTPALERYERLRGFHPDVMLFPVEERSKLAFQDLSDIVVGHLTGLTLTHAFIEAERDFRYQVPILAFAAFMLEAGDITNFMRIYEGQVAKMDESLKVQLDDRLSLERYFLSEPMRSKRLNDLEFRMLIDRKGDMIIRSRTMARYRTVDQIIAEETFVNAVLAQEVLGEVQYPEKLAPRKAEQQEALKQFVVKAAMTEKLKAQKKALPKDEQSDYVETLRWRSGALEDDLRASGVKEPEKAAQAVISAVEGGAKGPLFGRVVKALNGVSALFGPKI